MWDKMAIISNLITFDFEINKNVLEPLKLVNKIAHTVQ